MDQSNSPTAGRDFSLPELLQLTLDRNASDLHLVVGSPPIIRVDGKLLPVAGANILTPEVSKTLVFALFSFWKILSAGTIIIQKIILK